MSTVSKCVKWKKAAVDWLLEISRDGAVQRVLENNISPSREHCQRICEKITNRNILPNQFSAALPIFSRPKRGGLSPPPKFSFRRLPPLPTCPSPSAAYEQTLFILQQAVMFINPSLNLILTTHAISYILQTSPFLGV